MYSRVSAWISVLRHVSHPCPRGWAPVTLLHSVSAWTWSATLLQSSTAAYTFGMAHNLSSLPQHTLTAPRCQRPLVSRFMPLQALTNPSPLRWYGAGGSIQVAMFGMVAAKVKMNANGAHTFLEVRIDVCQVRTREQVC